MLVVWRVLFGLFVAVVLALVGPSVASAQAVSCGTVSFPVVKEDTDADVRIGSSFSIEITRPGTDCAEAVAVATAFADQDRYDSERQWPKVPGAPNPATPGRPKVSWFCSAESVTEIKASGFECEDENGVSEEGETGTGAMFSARPVKRVQGPLDQGCGTVTRAATVGGIGRRVRLRLSASKDVSCDLVRKAVDRKIKSGRSLSPLKCSEAKSRVDIECSFEDVTVLRAKQLSSRRAKVRFIGYIGGFDKDPVSRHEQGAVHYLLLDSRPYTTARFRACLSQGGFRQCWSGRVTPQSYGPINVTSTLNRSPGAWKATWYVGGRLVASKRFSVQSEGV